jgi:dihydropteroate synthase
MNTPRTELPVMIEESAPPSIEDTDRLWCRDRYLACPRLQQGVPVVMGILNVTPDSFSDGGAFVSLDSALRRVDEMIREGATVIDVGGESTRPRGAVYGEGAERIQEDEELRRVVPVIEGIAARFPDTLVSIDTYKPGVARDAVSAGAHIINDVSGLRQGRETAEVAANTGAALIVMHAVGTPGALPHDHAYGDVVREVTGSLARSVAVAHAAGVRGVAVDPGFGFGKTPAENLRLINHLEALRSLDCPVMVGVSRKSTIGTYLGSADTPRPVLDRLHGTHAVTAIALLRGASIVRAHDVKETVDLVTMMHETIRA